MEINRREVSRYLGYRSTKPDDRVLSLIEEVIEDMQKHCNPQSVLRDFLCEINHDEITFYDEFNKLQVKSEGLGNNLKDCKRAVIFAATLGNYPDLLIRKYEITNIAKASIVQAVGAAYIEAYCDTIQNEVKEKCLLHGLSLRPRFSPGYGDLPLSFQKDIFQILSCEKRIGVTLTDSLLMLPSKSVTAIIGIIDGNESCNIEKCKNCSKKDCEFRDENKE